MQSLNTVQLIAVMAIPMLFAITVHEAAHGWMAEKYGDKTARMLGRITLNPLRHIDPLGTVLVPIMMFLFVGFPVGWAKPVPVNWRNFRNPRKDMGMVALAGPMSNLVMAIIWSLAIKLGELIAPFTEWLGLPLVLMGIIGVFFNSALMVLNLVPIPPLDGSRVLNVFLPPRLSLAYSRLEPYGMFIVIGLLAFGILGWVILPVIRILVAILPASDRVLPLLY
jgi:Zn-dependent protease